MSIDVSKIKPGDAVEMHVDAPRHLLDGRDRPVQGVVTIIGRVYDAGTTKPVLCVGGYALAAGVVVDHSPEEPEWADALVIKIGPEYYLRDRGGLFVSALRGRYSVADIIGAGHEVTVIIDANGCNVEAEVAK